MRTVNPQKVENRKNQILDAAKHCFEQKGFHATTMAEICARAQISPGALYRYFSSKEEIIDAMCDEQQFRSLALLSSVRGKIKNSIDFQNALKMIISDVIENYCNKEHGAMAAELIAEAMRNDSFAKNAAISYISYQTEFAKLLEIGQKLGEIDERLNLEEAAGMLMAVVDGLVLRIAFCDDIEKDKIKEWLFNLSGRYLCPNRNINLKKLNQPPVQNLGA
ncbi:MAG: TetR/AcrR family transcriptional regulator [Caulobacterales bacterium]|nr:TetR/AcrR family transcriptional regulator [Caulobacterales bacterium]MCA0371923.1 TetR/AcrR family transcriptional regulator [Pseudomonadota bacterium]